MAPEIVRALPETAINNTQTVKTRLIAGQIRMSFRVRGCLYLYQILFNNWKISTLFKDQETINYILK